MRQQVYFIISDHVGSISRSRIDPSDNEPWNQKLLSDIVHQKKNVYTIRSRRSAQEKKGITGEEKKRRKMDNLIQRLTARLSLPSFSFLFQDEFIYWTWKTSRTSDPTSSTIDKSDTALITHNLGIEKYNLFLKIYFECRYYLHQLVKEYNFYLQLIVDENGGGRGRDVLAL